MMIKEWQETKRILVSKKYSRAIERVDFILLDGSEPDFYIKQLRSGLMTDVEVGYLALDYLGKL